MSVIRPRYFGFEGEFYWNTTSNLFPLQADETVLDADVTTWLSGANRSDEVISMDYSLERERFDITSRPTAFRGYARDYLTTNRANVTFRVFHNINAAGLVANLISAATSVVQLPLAIMHFSSPPRQGLLGNFNITITKSEPIRGIQTWNVSAIPQTYVDYWIEP